MREVEELLPIPTQLPAVDGWKELPIEEGGQPLVPLGPFTEDHRLFTSSIYYGEHSNSPYLDEQNKLAGAMITLFVRERVAERLRHAQLLLPESYHLIILDTFRSLQVQDALYQHYHDHLALLHPDWTADQLSSETQKYVSLPSTDPSRPSPHNTGGSVDLAICHLPEKIDTRVAELTAEVDQLRLEAPKDFGPEEEARHPVLRRLYLAEMLKISLVRRHAQFLDFGTRFDHGGPEAALNYMELLGTERSLTTAELEARDHRRLLYKVMIEAGMQGYLDEWWHYNAPENQMGARTAGLDTATYGAALLSTENEEHEQMRRQHHAGLIRIQERTLLEDDPGLGREPLWQELIALNQLALEESGDPRLAYLPSAAIIEPSGQTQKVS